MTLALAENTANKAAPIRNVWRLRLPIARLNWKVRIGGGILLAMLLAGLIASWWSGQDPFAQDMANTLAAPSVAHLLGTDEFGRDVLVRILWGARLAVLTAGVSIFATLFFGLPLGLAAGYLGGAADALIMRVVDIILAFPNFLLAISIVAIMGPGLANMLIAIAIFGVPSFVRIYRAEVLALKQAEYVEAARSMGGTSFQIIVRHILPNSLPLVIILCNLRAASAILVASGLSFLGLGVQPPLPEWGAMLANGREYLRSAPHLMVAPGIAIIGLVFAFNLLGDGVRGLLDTRRKG